MYIVPIFLVFLDSLYAFQPTARYKCQEDTNELKIGVFLSTQTTLIRYVNNFTGDLFIDQEAFEQTSVK